MYNIIGKRLYWYIFSGLMAALAIVAISVWGLRLGIDFKGGSSLTIRFDNQVNATDIKDTVSNLNLQSLSVLPSSNNTIIIRSIEITTETKNKLLSQVKAKYPSAGEDSFQTIGPVVSHDLTTRAIWAVILAALGIIIYVAIAFRGVPKPANSWRFGVCAVAALLHDLLIVTGVAAILGHFFAWMEIDSLFITALLTILGFSVHDTIVVFDRLRENLKRNPGTDFEQLANESVVQTLSRSINTSVTTMIVLTSLFLLGGTSIKGFIFTLLFGILIGTYSSIFNATPLLVSWQKYSQKPVKSIK
jgi:preprotein translocase subunit SecF